MVDFFWHLLGFKKFDVLSHKSLSDPVYEINSNDIEFSSPSIV